MGRGRDARRRLHSYDRRWDSARRRGSRMSCHDANGELPTRRPSQEHGIGPPIDPHALLFETVGGVMMGGDLRSVVSP
jgi:hypothetical protein